MRTPGSTGSGCSRRWGRKCQGRTPAFPLLQCLCGVGGRAPAVAGSRAFRSEQERLAQRDRDSARRLLDAVLSAGDWVLTPEDAYYPSLLLGLPDFPLVLYGRGEMPDLEHLPTVGMVGTRKCSDEGRRAAGDIARELSLHGVVIVSGGAEGIDAASHWGSLIRRRTDGGGPGLRSGCGLSGAEPGDALSHPPRTGRSVERIPPTVRRPCAIIFPCATGSSAGYPWGCA